jgi:hypothetical protein
MTCEACEVPTTCEGGGEALVSCGDACDASPCDAY